MRKSQMLREQIDALESEYGDAVRAERETARTAAKAVGDLVYEYVAEWEGPCLVRISRKLSAKSAADVFEHNTRFGYDAIRPFEGGMKYWVLADGSLAPNGGGAVVVALPFVDGCSFDRVAPVTPDQMALLRQGLVPIEWHSAYSHGFG